MDAFVQDGVRIQRTDLADAAYRVLRDRIFTATLPPATRYGPKRSPVLAIADGLTARLGVHDGTAIAMLGVKDWNFRQPVFFGDTVYVRITIVGKRETSHADQGIITRRIEVFNQRDELIEEGDIAFPTTSKRLPSGI